MLEFYDGFDGYTSFTNLQRKWDSASLTGGTATGRFAGNAWSINNTTNQNSVTLASVATRVCGFAFQFKTFFYGGTAAFLFIKDSGSVQVDLRMNTSGNLVLTRNGTTLATSTNTLAPNIWYYLELKVTIGPSAAYEVRVNGSSSGWISGTGNTQATGNATSNQIAIAGPWVDNWFDDFYILNTSGSVNDFLGECRVMGNTPNAEGTTEQWTPNSGSAHYSRVNEANPDDDSSYVSSATAGQIDTYKFPSISPTGLIVAVQVNLCQRKDDAGVRTTCVEYRSGGGTDFDGPTTFTPGSGYRIDREIFETDPATSAAWTASGINNGEFGIKCVS